MPRVSFGYKLGEKNVIKGGYGMYYDTLNARDWTPNQDGYDVTTTNQLSNDFGQTFRWAIREHGDPAAGQSFPRACLHRQPLRARARQLAGRTTTCWAAAIRPKIRTACTRACRDGGWAGSANSDARTAVEVAYAGSYADRQGISIRQDYLPEQYWSSAKSATRRRTIT